MRKKVKLLLLFCLPFLLFGCGRKPAVLRAMVVKAEIRYQHQDEMLYRCYTSPEKIQAVLLSLRRQKVLGIAREDPESISGDDCRIDLTYRDGSTGVILQRGSRLRSRNYQKWEAIDQEEAEKFYPFLEQLPGDVSQTWVLTDSGRRCPVAV